MLAKTASLKTLDQNVSHVEQFETALWDENNKTFISDVAALRMSMYFQQNWVHNREQTMNNNGSCPITTWNYDNIVGMWTHRNACKDCCSNWTNNWQGLCLTRGQTLNACDNWNHFTKVCRSTRYHTKHQGRTLYGWSHCMCKVWSRNWYLHVKQSQRLRRTRSNIISILPMQMGNEPH